MQLYLLIELLHQQIDFIMSNKTRALKFINVGAQTAVHRNLHSFEV